MESDAIRRVGHESVIELVCTLLLVLAALCAGRVDRDEWDDAQLGGMHDAKRRT